MANVPRIAVDAYDVTDDHARAFSGTLDLTYALVRDMTPYTAGEPRRAQMPPLVMTISPSLTEQQRHRAFAGKLAVPGIEVAYERFLGEIGGLDGVRDFRVHLDMEQQLLASVADAVATETAVHAAALSSLDEFQMVTPLHGHLDYIDVSDVDDAYDDFEWDEYLSEHPMPEVDSWDYQAWSAARRAWVRRNAPPMLFGTSAIRWSGVLPEEVRQEHRDTGIVDVESMISNDLENHYEDAYDDVNGNDRIHEIIDAWLPHAGLDTQPDLALEADLAVWNSLQTIVSYLTNRKLVVPAFPDVTKEEIDIWATRVREAAEARLAEFQMEWSQSFELARQTPAI